MTAAREAPSQFLTNFQPARRPKIYRVTLLHPRRLWIASWNAPWSGPLHGVPGARQLPTAGMKPNVALRQLSAVVDNFKLLFDEKLLRHVRDKRMLYLLGRPLRATRLRAPPPSAASPVNASGTRPAWSAGVPCASCGSVEEPSASLPPGAKPRLDRQCTPRRAETLALAVRARDSWTERVRGDDEWLCRASACGQDDDQPDHHGSGRRQRAVPDEVGRAARQRHAAPQREDNTRLA